MTDLVVLVVGCGVSFTFLAGCYIYMKENLETVEFEVGSTEKVGKEQSTERR